VSIYFNLVLKKKKNRQQIDCKKQQQNILLKVANLTTVQSHSGRSDYSPENQIKKNKIINYIISKQKDVQILVNKDSMLYISKWPHIHRFSSSFNWLVWISDVLR